VAPEWQHDHLGRSPDRGLAVLSDEDVVAIVRSHLESKFPRRCSRCGRRFDSLASYLRGTTHLGHPVSADDPLTSTESSRLIGTISYANCSCGTTLTLSSAGLDFLTMWRLLQWAGASISRRGISMGELLTGLRGRIDEEVLRDADAQNPIAG
jgi:hypothetical protein